MEYGRVPVNNQDRKNCWPTAHANILSGLFKLEEVARLGYQVKL